MKRDQQRSPGLRRRGLILAALAIPLIHTRLYAQQSAKLPRVVMISTVDPQVFERGARAEFARGMRERGYGEGKSYLLEASYAKGEENLAEVIGAAIATNPDVLVVGGLHQAKLAKEATSKVPIVVATSSDPVDAGLIKSLARPGGNLTGLGDSIDETVGKRVELVRELLPAGKSVALLIDTLFPLTEKLASTAENTAVRIGLKTTALRFGSRDALDRALDALDRSRSDALVLLGAAPLIRNFPAIVERATKAKIPVIHFWLPQAELGAVITHGADVRDNYRRSARLVDRILKGANPADLPFELTTQFQLVVNLKIARQLGITVPESILVRADRVLQ